MFLLFNVRMFFKDTKEKFQRQFLTLKEQKFYLQVLTRQQGYGMLKAER